MEKPDLNCSFCGRGHESVEKFITGKQNVFICNYCIDECYSVLSSGAEKQKANPKKNISGKLVSEKKIPTPREIKEYLDQYVIGQSEAKETIAVAVYNHFKRLNQKIGKNDVPIEKSNIMMLGPTGSGKTLIAQTIAKLLDVPLVITDATTLTETGYVGDDADSIIARLVQAAGGDVKKAEHGIVFIDEIDKKRSRSTGGGSRDVSGEGVQQSLLKLIEGSEVMIAPGGNRKAYDDMITVDTSNILFIVSGAFVGLEKIASKGEGNSIGFAARTPKQSVGDVDIEPKHLVEFGMIPELIGRLPVIATLKDLSEEELVLVLTEPKNSIIKQFVSSFKMDDIILQFTDAAYRAIVRETAKNKTGTRGLRAILEKRMRSLQFILPELKNDNIIKVIIDENFIDGKAPAILKKRRLKKEKIAVISDNEIDSVQEN